MPKMLNLPTKMHFWEKFQKMQILSDVVTCFVTYLALGCEF